MNSRALVAALALGVLGAGPAMAQVDQSCADIKKALTLAADQVKAMRGEVAKTDVAYEDKYAAKIQIAGFSNCTLSVKKQKGTYWENHLQCAHAFADGEDDAAYTMVEDLTRCLGDTFSEREQKQRLVEGKYRTEETAGSVTTQGRDTKLSFGNTDYANLRAALSKVVKLHVDLHIYYSFLSQ